MREEENAVTTASPEGRVRFFEKVVGRITSEEVNFLKELKIGKSAGTDEMATKCLRWEGAA